MTQNPDSFSEKHPIINFILGLLIIAIISILCGFLFVRLLSLFGLLLEQGINILKVIAKLDAVVIVAIISAVVSFVGFIFTSIISKVFDYRQKRREYLAQKREIPYGEFVEMVYKLQKNTKDKNAYTQKEMEEDLSKFSKQITLWGSENVVNKWVKFRDNSLNSSDPKDNLFILEDIMNEMRKDLGLGKVHKGNLLAFFITILRKL